MLCCTALAEDPGYLGVLFGGVSAQQSLPFKLVVGDLGDAGVSRSNLFLVLEAPKSGVRVFQYTGGTYSDTKAARFINR